ncbi:hypothetical protein ABKV19_017787 [Rosa sericea]
MVQHTIDSKTNEYGLGTTEAELSIHDKQLSVPVKKTVLRDVQNDNRIAVPSSAGSSSPLKDKIPSSNAPRVSGTKRPLSECQMIPPEQQPPSSTSANGHLVYVRRKSEADAVRSSTNDNASINADGQASRKLSNQEASTGPISQTKEPTVHSANDHANINADCQVLRIVSHQEAGTGQISQTKEPTVHSANDNASINADGQASRKLSNQEASTGPISQTKEPTVHSANDNANINADCEVLRIISHQEAGTGPISQTKEPEVHCADDNASINADCQVLRKLSNEEASSGPISQRKEPQVQFTNDNASINADCEVSRIVSHQEAGARPISKIKEPKVHCANDNARINADCEVLRIVNHQEAGTGPVSKTKEPKVHFANDNASIKADCQVSRINSHQEASSIPISQTKEPTVHNIPAFAPFPREAAAIPPGKPSVSLPHNKSDVRGAPAGSTCQPLASATPSLGSSKGLKNLHWEERFHQLQLLLRKLDQSDHEDYLKMLRSLSSVELSRHAVELEKRSIQLSLEEAKELKRVGVLNVLGKPMKPFKVPSTLQDRSEK